MTKRGAAEGEQDKTVKKTASQTRDRQTVNMKKVESRPQIMITWKIITDKHTGNGQDTIKKKK